MRKNNKKRKSMWTALLGISLSVAVVSGGMCVKQFAVEAQAKEQMEILVASVSNAPSIKVDKNAVSKSTTVNKAVSNKTTSSKKEDANKATTKKTTTATNSATTKGKSTTKETTKSTTKAATKKQSIADMPGVPLTEALEAKYQAYANTYGIEIPRKNLNFDFLQQNINSDIYAWLYVPGTNVDTPVVQHPTNDAYYLNYNLDGSKGYPGGIYTEGSCNTKTFMDRMTVIYGHNMKNGTGFGSLHNFEQKAFFDQNRYMFIYTPDDIFVYEIFASYQGSSNHIIYGHDWNDSSWVQYLSDTLRLTGPADNSVAAKNFYAKDKVVTLVTCVRNSPNQRYLVQGVLLDACR